MKMRMLLGAVVLVAVVVTAVSAARTPTYEASALVMVGPKEQSDGKIHPIPNAPAPERLRELAQAMVIAIETRPVAEEAIQRLGLQMKPAELLDRLTVEQDAGTSFIRLTYEDTDPESPTDRQHGRRSVLRAHLSNKRGRQQLYGHGVGEGGSTRKPGEPSPLEERVRCAGDRAGALRGDRPCPAGRRHKGRRHTRRTALPPKGRPSGGTRQAAQRPQHSRAHKGEKAASGARAPREADGGRGGA
jgi:hypothetical protein